MEIIYKEYIKISKCIVHAVGNKSNDSGLFLSDSEISLDQNTSKILLNYLLDSFTSKDFYNFYHESEISLNELFAFASKMFDNIDSFYDQSLNIARHLYSCSLHPKIKEGDLCILYMKNVIVDTDTCDAIGIFKSENKDVFLKIVQQDGRTLIQSDKGININKLDKGCIIFNTDKQDGYKVAVVDNINKQIEAKYWTEDFLKVRPISNNYNKTKCLIEISNDYISNIPNITNKIDKVNMANRSLEALKTDHVLIDEYAHNVFEDESREKSFKEYLEKKSTEKGFYIENSIDVSKEAYKTNRQPSLLRKIILDDNFDITIHNGNEFIECGYDKEKNMRFYKLYYDEEK